MGVGSSVCVGTLVSVRISRSGAEHAAHMSPTATMTAVPRIAQRR
jgi:hypothetical protein